MEIVVHAGKSVGIGVTSEERSVTVGRGQPVRMEIASQSVEIRAAKSRGMAFKFVQNVIGGSDVVRCTLDEFRAIQRLDGETWYAVTTTSDELRYLYLGPTLIAKAGDDGGTWGFAYTFPITFGR